MKFILSYIKNNKKIIITILTFIIILVALTFFYQNILKKNVVNYETLYDNKLSKMILENNVDTVNYDFLNDDLNSIDGILKEQISFEVDKNKKNTYYSIAEKIYTKKMYEYISILNKKLDDEDFERLSLDIDDFERNLDFAIVDMENSLESTFDIEFYKNKYLYEEKQSKCRELLETYKGFLQ